MIGQSVLYVFDEGATAPPGWSGVERLVLCPVTTDGRVVESVVESAKVEMTRTIELVDYAERFNNKAFAVRDSYVRFIGDFPTKPLFNGRDLKEYLGLASGFSAWWLSSIAEKNTMASPAFAGLAALLSVIEIQREHKCDEIWIDLRDRRLTQALVANASVLAGPVIDQSQGHPVHRDSRAAGLGQIVRDIAKLAFKALMGKWAARGSEDRELVERAKYLLVTYFPLIDKEAWSSRRIFINRYYGALQEELEAECSDRLVWLAIYAKLDGVGWREALKLARDARAEGYPIVFVERWLGFKDLAAILAVAMRLAFSWRKARSTLEREFVFAHAGAEVSLWALFQPDWRDSFGGSGFIKAFAHYRMFSRVFEQSDQGAVVLYLSEMLAWEKGLNMAAHGRNEMTTIGIQHTTVPLLLLNFALDRSEWEGRYGAEAIPAPTQLATVGEVTSEMMVASGWPADRVVPLAAMRFAHFKDILGQRFSWSDRERSVVLALSYSPEESQELLVFAWQAFSDGDFQVLVKAHPNCPVHVLEKALDIELDPTRFTVSEEPLHELLPRARAMVVGGSSAVFDGLACGCPVFIPRLVRSVDKNPLSGLCDLQVYASDPADLRTKVDHAVNAGQAPVSVEESQAFVRRYFRLPDSEGRLLVELEEQIGARVVRA